MEITDCQDFITEEEFLKMPLGPLPGICVGPRSKGHAAAAVAVALQVSDPYKRNNVTNATGSQCWNARLEPLPQQLAPRRVAAAAALAPRHVKQQAVQRPHPLEQRAIACADTLAAALVLSCKHVDAYSLVDFL